MGEVIGTIIALLILGLLVSWIGWPVAALAEAERITTGQAFLVFLAGSIGIFVVVAALTYFFMEEAQAYTHSPQNGTATSEGRAQPTGPKFTHDGLIQGHAVQGRKVAAYETHWVGPYKFTFAFVPWPTEKHRIYILKSPSYRGRSNGAHETHRFHDSTLNRHFICINSSAYPDTLTDARELALMWAQATARYIDTGENFG